MNLDDPTRAALTSAELEEGRAAVAHHLGCTPNWVSRLLAGDSLEITREQGAFFAAWKARFGVTETTKTDESRREPRNSPIQARGADRPATIVGGALAPAPPESSRAETGEGRETSAEMTAGIPDSGQKTPESSYGQDPVRAGAPEGGRTEPPPATRSFDADFPDPAARAGASAATRPGGDPMPLPGDSSDDDLPPF